MQLHESAKNVLIEQAQADVLREAFLYDVRRLEEARAKLGVLITEGYLSEEDLDAEILENYENLTISEKSDLNELIEALNSFDETELLSEAPRKAAAAPAGKKPTAGKAPVAGGDKKAKVAALTKKVQATVAGAKKASTGAKKAPAGAKPPVAGKAAAPAPGAKKPAARKAAPASKAVAQKAIQDIVAKMAKDDPAQFAKLQAAAQDPQKLQAVLASPAVQQNKTAVTGEIAQTPGADPAKPGLLGKLGAWAKKHPVKAGVGLAAIAALGTAAAIGTGGLAPLLGAALLGAGKGAAIAGTIGAVSGGAKQAIGDKMAGNKFSLKNIGKAAWSGLKKGAVVGAIGGAAGGVLGKIASNAGFGPGSHSAGGDTNQIHRQTTVDASEFGDHDQATGLAFDRDQIIKSMNLQAGRNDMGAISDTIDDINNSLKDGLISKSDAQSLIGALKKGIADGLSGGGGVSDLIAKGTKGAISGAAGSHGPVDDF